ncbi:hypothetical protein FKW77_009622 [Venturia effusa]|uniref:Uncharacterized protein n=1 Tax=Venturia effusa TaxID=50376 RepID=A0A517KXC8_9PEZI|nr:hypothetical protein FKW77_009622 [Venturia effusa]
MEEYTLNNRCGKFYTTKSRDHCYHLGLRYKDIGARAVHMVIVLTDENCLGEVLACTITTKTTALGVDFRPIHPNPRGAWASQIFIQDDAHLVSPGAPTYHDSFMRMQPFLLPADMLTPLWRPRMEEIYLEEDTWWNLLVEFGRTTALLRAEREARLQRRIAVPPSPRSLEEGEIEEFVEQAPSLPMTPEEETDFLESLV